MKPQKTETKSTSVKEVVSMRELLECGVHFGHQTKRWNPKMKPYIFTSRNGIHIIDLQQTIKIIKNIYTVIKNTAKQNKSILFVGTKKQAQDTVKEEALRCDMPFVNHRWLGGTLTNISTIRQSINKYKKYLSMIEDNSIQKLSNKEAARIKKNLSRLSYYLSGVKDMGQLPGMIIVADVNKEQLAIREAKKLGIPIVGIVDTNANPNDVDYCIPANDDAIRSIKLLFKIFANAINDGKNESEVHFSTETSTAEIDSDNSSQNTSASNTNTAEEVSDETVVLEKTNQ
jgi:small subunit ribosomal protein S2